MLYCDLNIVKSLVNTNLTKKKGGYERVLTKKQRVLDDSHNSSRYGSLFEMMKLGASLGNEVACLVFNYNENDIETARKLLQVIHIYAIDLFADGSLQ